MQDKKVGFRRNNLSRMQFTLHANRRTHHGASRLVIGCELGPAKAGVLGPGFVGMRGQWSYDYGMQNY